MTAFKKCVLSVSATLLIIGCGNQPDAVRKKREPKHPEPAAKNHLYPTNSSPRPSQTTAQTFQAEKPVISVWEAAKTGEMATLKQHALTGTDLNRKTSTGWTPLHFAYSNRKKNAIQFLLENGADPNAKNEKGVAPIDLSLIQDAKNNSPFALW